MARVNFLMLAEVSHYLASMTLGHYLKDAGHSVCYITIPRYTSFFQSQGFDTFNIGIPGPFECRGTDVFAEPFTGKAFGRYLKEHLDRLVGLGIGPEEFLASELKQTPCDLLVVDAYLGGLMKRIGSRVDAHVVTLSVTLPELDYCSANSPYEELIVCPYCFEIPGKLDVPAERLYGEPSLHTSRQMIVFPWNQMDHHKPLIYCSFGTQASGYSLAPQVLTSLIRAFARMQAFQFVVVHGGIPIEAEPSELQNALFVSSAPQPELLDHAAAFITHGGLGGVKEAIVARVPMIVVPFVYDQPANAKRVDHHRIGHSVTPENCDPLLIQDLLADAVCNVAIRHNIAEMSEQFKAIEERAPIAEHLLSLLACPNK